MSRDTDALRRALESRARGIAVPAPDGLEVLRLRVLLARVRTATAISAAVLLVAGLAAALGVSSTTERTTTVDLAGGGASAPSAPAHDTTTTTNPAGGGPAGAGDDGGAGASEGPPGSIGPSGPDAAPPTTEALPSAPPPARLTFATAVPGRWWYLIDFRRGKDVLGNDDGLEDFQTSLCARPAQGTTQVLDGEETGHTYFAVMRSTHDLAAGVALRELTLSNAYDSAKSFVLPAGAFEVPPPSDWSTPSSYEATSTDGATRLRATVHVDGLEDVDVNGTMVRTVRAVTELHLAGDRSLTAIRTTWWAVDLGVPARILETMKGTSSTGEQVDVWADAALAEVRANAYTSLPPRCQG